MEDDEQRDCAVLKHQPEQIGDHPELQQVRHRVRQYEDAEPQQDANGARALKEEQHSIEHEAHERYFQQVAPAGMKKPEMLEAVHSPFPCRIAHATSSA